MTHQTKCKLCWNCEGRVGLTEEHCSFCGVYLSPASSYNESEEKEEDYSPPYNNEPESYTEIPQAPYTSEPKTKKNYPETAEASEASEKSSLTSLFSDRMFQTVYPLGLLLAGAIFSLFGLVLLLFSDSQGRLTLQWEGGYWYIYLLISTGMLFFGWKALSQLDEAES